MTFYDVKPLVAVSGIFVLLVVCVLYVVPAFAEASGIGAQGYLAIAGGVVYWLVFAFWGILTFCESVESVEADRLSGRKGQWASVVFAMILAIGLGVVYYAGYDAHGTWLWCWGFMPCIKLSAEECSDKRPCNGAFLLAGGCLKVFVDKCMHAGS